MCSYLRSSTYIKIDKHSANLYKVFSTGVAQDPDKTFNVKEEFNFH